MDARGGEAATRALARCLTFIRKFDEGCAQRIEPFRYGSAFFVDELPRVWSLNFLAVGRGSAATAEELEAEADRLQGGAGLRHRKLCVDDDELGARLAPELRAGGWTVQPLVVMVRTRPGREVDVARAEEVEHEELHQTWEQGIRSAPWGSDEETVRQLLAAQHRRRQAVEVRYLAARADGRIGSYCELFSDGETGQIESVLTLEELRGRGLASAVVARAAAESEAAGHELTFLVADAEGWPRELYRKLGFDPVGRIWDFVRTPTSDRPA